MLLISLLCPCIFCHQRCGFQARPYIQFNGFPPGIPLRSVLIYMPELRSGDILVHSPPHFQAGTLGMVNGRMVRAIILHIYIYIYTHIYTHIFTYTHTYNHLEERITSIISEDSGYSFIFLQGFKLILGSVSHRPDLFSS